MKLITLTNTEIRKNKYYINSLKCKYGFQFFKPSHKKVPFASSQLTFPDLKKRIFRLENFLLNTFVINMGNNVHKEINKIKYKLSSEEYEWFRNHNKLAKAHWGSLITGMLILNPLFKKNNISQSDISFSSEIIYECHKYNFYSFKKKIEYCNKIDKEVYQILTQIYK